MVDIEVVLIGKSYKAAAKGSPLAAVDDLACLANMLLIVRCWLQVA